MFNVFLIGKKFLVGFLIIRFVVNYVIYIVILLSDILWGKKL